MPNATGKPSLILVSTGDALSARQAEIDRMVASVAAFARRNPSVAVRLFLLMQRCGEGQAREVVARLPEWVDLHLIERRISLSKARNMMLGPHAAGAVIGGRDIVAFPDDDCWYPDGVLDRVHAAFGTDDDLDFWFCRYASKPVPADSGTDAPARLGDAVARASSNTIFLRGRIVRMIGGYDERLGVGTDINGGEDTDYAVRAFHAARRSRFLDAAVVGHRDFDPALRARYFTGAFVALARHAGRSPAGLWAGGRKAAVGLALVGTGRMKPSQFVQSLRLAVWRNRPAVPDPTKPPEFTRAPGR